MLQQQERFYVVRVEALEVDVSGWDELERQFMTEPRWWTVEELEAPDDAFAPSRLARHLADLLRGAIPAEPIDVGV